MDGLRRRTSSIGLFSQFFGLSLRRALPMVRVRVRVRVRDRVRVRVRG
jgi:hypothetical protein